MLKATLAQVKQGKNGRLIEIGQDVLDVCARIKEIDPALGVDYNDGGGFFRITELCADGRTRVVCYLQELTADVPDHIRRVAKENYVAEVERQDAQAERDRDHRIHEWVGPIGERMHHAIGKDKGWKNRAFVPRDV